MQQPRCQGRIPSGAHRQQARKHPTTTGGNPIGRLPSRRPHRPFPPREEHHEEPLPQSLGSVEKCRPRRIVLRPTPPSRQQLATCLSRMASRVQRRFPPAALGTHCRNDARAPPADCGRCEVAPGSSPFCTQTIGLPHRLGSAAVRDGRRTRLVHPKLFTQPTDPDTPHFPSHPATPNILALDCRGWYILASGEHILALVNHRLHRPRKVSPTPGGVWGPGAKGAIGSWVKLLFPHFLFI